MKTTSITKQSSVFTSTEYKPQGLLTLGLQGAKTVMDFIAPDIDYQKLKLQAGYKQNQADSIDLKAQEQANYIRGQFAGAVGSYKSNTAKRNVKVGEGSAGMNVESSARDLGFDISKMKDNASFQSGILRSQAEMYNQAAKDQKGINEWDKIAGLFDNIGKMAGIYGLIEETKTETKILENPDPPKKPDPPIKKPDPPKKPMPKDDFKPIELDEWTVDTTVKDEKRVNTNMDTESITIANNNSASSMENKEITGDEIRAMSVVDRRKLARKMIKDKAMTGSDVVAFFGKYAENDSELAAILKRRG